jgi:hypothetical protein
MPVQVCLVVEAGRRRDLRWCQPGQQQPARLFDPPTRQVRVRWQPVRRGEAAYEMRGAGLELRGGILQPDPGLDPLIEQRPQVRRKACRIRPAVNGRTSGQMHPQPTGHQRQPALGLERLARRGQHDVELVDTPPQ